MDMNLLKPIHRVYDEIVQWRKNLSKIPSGNAAKMFKWEVTSRLEHFDQNSEYTSIALKVYMTVASLLLQKPTRNSKAKDHAEELEEHLLIWKGRKIMDLVKEAESFKNALDDPGNEHPKIMQRSAQTWWCKGELAQPWKFWLPIHELAVFTRSMKMSSMLLNRNIQNRLQKTPSTTVLLMKS